MKHVANSKPPTSNSSMTMNKTHLPSANSTDLPSLLLLFYEVNIRTFLDVEAN